MITQLFNFPRPACALKLALAMSLCTGVAGQESEGGGELEEIVVTAGFRDNFLMTTPGSVSVVDQAVIEDRGARHLESVLNISPNVNYSSGASRARFVQVRGVGDLEQFVGPKHYPSVGITLDDINIGGTANAGMLFDTSQVEVLRGPQGTRFGGSALAGMVNIRSNAPTEVFEAFAEAGAGSYGSWNLGGVVSGPLSDKVSARLAVQQIQTDGYIDNDFLRRDDTNGRDEQTIRGQFRFEATDASTYTLTLLKFDGENGYDAFSLDNTRNTLSDQPGRDNQETTAVAGKGEWQVGDSTVVQAVATWLESDLEYGFDEDWTFAGICDGTLCDPVFDFFSNTDNYLRERSEISFDLRVLGDSPSGNLQYVVGAYLQQRDEDLHRQYYGDFFSFYETEREAVYGQIDFALNDRWSITAGLRIENFEGTYSDSFAFSSVNDDRLESGELTLSYQAFDATLIYATVARGDKAGGVNTEASSNLALMQPVFQDFVGPRLSVETETLINREFGLKGRYFDDRLDLRAAVFHMDRSDAQIESWMWDAVGFLWVGFLDNVDGSNLGAELEMGYEVSDVLSLYGSLGWLDTEIEEIRTFDLDLGDFQVKRNIDQAKAPSWQYHLGAHFRLNDRWVARVELEGRDDSRFGYYHDAETGSYDLMNASLRYRSGNVEYSLWGRNLTDEDYAVHGLYFANDPRKGWINETYYQYGEPRVVGVSVRLYFQ